jgi:hypothetical protein
MASVVGRENKICELAIRRLMRKCAVFEEKHALTSDDFYTLWQQGKMDDDLDYFEWKALIEGIEEWKRTQEELKKIAIP